MSLRMCVWVCVCVCVCVYVYFTTLLGLSFSFTLTYSLLFLLREYKALKHSSTKPTIENKEKAKNRHDN